MNWYLAALKNYAGFSGRARRKEYWMFTLFNFIICFALTFIEVMVGGPGILGMLYMLAVIIPGIAVTIRRLHDTNKSGWFLLIALTAAALLFLVELYSGAGLAAAPAWALILYLGLWAPRQR